MISCHLHSEDSGSRCSVKFLVSEETREFLGGKLPSLCLLLPVSAFTLGAKTQKCVSGRKKP